jgi:tetratricopeptide (TPR) repeat protein
VSIVAFAGLVAFLCAFKVDDVDVWWHLKAGELMVRTGAWIETDPFAYTREGQPYSATYEWLAQIILYLVHSAGGATALIALRTTLVALTFFLLALINRPALWIALPIALLGAARVLPSLTERPHLFTYALLAAFLLMATRILDAGGRPTRRDAIVFLVLEVLWVNLHGGAALVGVAVWGALLLQVAWDARFSDRKGPAEAGHHVRLPLLIFGGLVLAQFAFPTGSSLTYLYGTATDQTRSFIAEWQPRAWGPYFRDLAPWWVATLLAIVLVRRKAVFSLATLLAFGGLSWTAYRHEALFVMAATGVLMYQWRWSDASARAGAWLVGRVWRAGVILSLVYVLAGVSVYRAWEIFGRYFQTYGYGSLEMAGGAAAFLDREGISGPMFNTYDLGANLLYRGRKVFVDTRNVDYGYPFLQRLFEAANDKDVWNGLDRDYRFTHAVLWYAPFVESPPIPYVRHLEPDPAWALVYLDDLTAVYLKRTGEAAAIARHQFRLVTPLDLYSGDVITRTPRAGYAELERELIRLAAAAPNSIQARLLLAQVYTLVNRYDDALTLLRGTMATAPRAYRPHALLAAWYARQDRWADAGREFETAIDLAGDTAVRFDYHYVAEVFEKAGDPAKAAAYRRRAQ